MGSVLDFSGYRPSDDDDLPRCMKDKYGTEKKAREAADRLNRRRRSKSTHVGPYRCGICPGSPYHLRTARPIEGKIKRREAALWERDAAA